MTNKRGQIPWKIIGIILALAVLAIFIYALATGTNPLFGAIGNFGGGNVNVQQAVLSCQQSCLTQSLVNYCGIAREIVFQKGQDKKTHTCLGLETAGVGLDRCTGINIEVCIATINKRLKQPSGFVEGGTVNTGSTKRYQNALNEAEENNRKVQADPKSTPDQKAAAIKAVTDARQAFDAQGQ
jgi:hypothetical protein